MLRTVFKSRRFLASPAIPSLPAVMKEAYLGRRPPSGFMMGLAGDPARSGLLSACVIQVCLMSISWTVRLPSGPRLGSSAGAGESPKHVHQDRIGAGTRDPPLIRNR